MKNNLNKFRDDAGLSLRKLGKDCGVSAAHINHLEKGLSVPTLATAYRIANVLGKSVYDIWPDTTEIVEETIIVRRVAIDN
jgi:DNA-binding XRE family transcriptional regulator